MPTTNNNVPSGYKPYKIENSDLVIPGWLIPYRGADIEMAVKLSKDLIKSNVILCGIDESIFEE